MFDPKLIAQKIREKQAELTKLKAEQSDFDNGDDFLFEDDLEGDDLIVQDTPESTPTTSKQRLDKIFRR